jgi:hypothetical protein
MSITKLVVDPMLSFVTKVWSIETSSLSSEKQSGFLALHFILLQAKVHFAP